MAWKNIVDKFGDENLNFPKEIFFLAGAPGAGKGLMTSYIKKIRGISTETIETSKLLNSPEAEEVKARGGLVASRHVVQLVLQKLLEKQFRQGVVVDGFPRTLEQGECIKLLRDKMVEYKEKYQNSKHSSKFTRPRFSITVLFIEEEVSIQRQLSRGRSVRLHNRRVTETGIGSLKSVRETDSNVELARERYRQFKDHIIPSLNRLKKYFNFHFILADSEPEVVKARILRELQYQSSSELQEATFDLVQTIPLASQILLDARIKLVDIA